MRPPSAAPRVAGPRVPGVRYGSCRTRLPAMIGRQWSRLRHPPAGNHIDRQRGRGFALPPVPTRPMFSKEISVERSSPSRGARPSRSARSEESVSRGEGLALGRARLFTSRNLGGYLFLLPPLFIFALFVWYPLVLRSMLTFPTVY